MIDKLHKISDEILGLTRCTLYTDSFCRTRVIHEAGVNIHITDEKDKRIDTDIQGYNINQYSIPEGKYTLTIFYPDGTLYYRYVFKITKEMYNTIFVINSVI